MRKLPPLNAVRTFEVAARHGSFTKAAEELHVTHGAVSRQVALLEEWFGIKLFRRTPSQVVLTLAGRMYLTELSAIFDRLALASMHVMQQAAPTVLRVNAPPTFTMRWLISRISSFQRQHVQVDLRLTTSLDPVAVHDDSYDLGIRGDQSTISGWDSEPFMTEFIAPVCHIDLPNQLPLRTPEDLRHHTLLTYVTEPYGWGKWCSQAGCSLSPTQNFMHLEQMYFALQATLERMGVVLVPLFLVIDDLMAGRLCLPFGPLGVRRRFYRAFYRHDTAHRPLIANFCAWLRDTGAETEGATIAWAQSKGWNLSSVH